MATSTFYWARIGVEPAGNADLNPTVDPAIEIEFTSIDPFGNTDGDLFLDNGTIDGEFDPDTWVIVNGVPYEFDVLTYGIVNHNNPSLYDFTASGGPNFNDFTLVTIQLDDGTRLIFYPTENFTEADMNFLPHGGVPLAPSPDYPITPPPVCFGKGTLITTTIGEVLIENISIGDLVVSTNGEALPVSWIGHKKMFRRSDQKFSPIRIQANALGNGLPKRDLLVSPQHRILLTDWRAELLFGEPEVLVAAKHLVNDKDITVATDLEEFEYFHILFDTHQTIFAEGVPTESFHPGDMAMKSLTSDARAELLEIFPELENDVSTYGPATHRSLKAYEAKALQSV